MLPLTLSLTLYSLQLHTRIKWCEMKCNDLMDCWDKDDWMFVHFIWCICCVSFCVLCGPFFLCIFFFFLFDPCCGQIISFSKSISNEISWKRNKNEYYTHAYIKLTQYKSMRRRKWEKKKKTENSSLYHTIFLLLSSFWFRFLLHLQSPDSHPINTNNSNSYNYV